MSGATGTATAMKVWHLVIFRTAPDVTSDKVAEIRSLFEACVGPCPGLEWVRPATNTSQSRFAEGWTEGIVMQFRDQASRDAYIDHPLHRRAGQAAATDLYTDLVVFDMDVDSDAAGGHHDDAAATAAARQGESVHE
jgi:hypothetical protein